MRPHPLPPLAAAGSGVPSMPAPALHSAPPERAEARTLVERLKAHIARLEETSHRLEPRRSWGRTAATREAARWTLGPATLDAHLPEQGLARNGLHDVAPLAYGHMPAAMGFALGLAVRRQMVDAKARPVLWCRSAIECQEHGRLYGHGARQLGLPRDKLLTVILKRQSALFWTMEEALKAGCFAVVLSDAASQHTDLTITRRLSLSAGDGHSAGLLILNRNHPEATASFSRWQVATAPSPPSSPSPPLHMAARDLAPAWAVTLARIRSGRPGHWTLTWQPLGQPIVSAPPFPHHDHASHHFSLVSGISGAALPARAPQTGSALPTPGPALRAG